MAFDFETVGRAQERAQQQAFPTSSTSPAGYTSGPPLPSPPPPLFNTKLPPGSFRREDAALQPPPSQPLPPTAPANHRSGPQQQRQGYSDVAGSLNDFLNGAYTGPSGFTRPDNGGGGCAGGAVRESSTFSVGGGGGGGGGLAVTHGLDAPLRDLIEAKERELHEIHDFRIR